MSQLSSITIAWIFTVVVMLFIVTVIYIYCNPFQRDDNGDTCIAKAQSCISSVKIPKIPSQKAAHRRLSRDEEASIEMERFNRMAGSSSSSYPAPTSSNVSPFHDHP